MWLSRLLTTLLAAAMLAAVAPAGAETVDFAPPARAHTSSELMAIATTQAAARGWVCWKNSDNARNLSRLRGVAVAPVGTSAVSFVSLDEALARSARGTVVAIASCGTLTR